MSYYYNIFQLIVNKEQGKKEGEVNDLEEGREVREERVIFRRWPVMNNPEAPAGLGRESDLSSNWPPLPLLPRAKKEEEGEGEDGSVVVRVMAHKSQCGRTKSPLPPSPRGTNNKSLNIFKYEERKRGREIKESNGVRDLSLHLVNCTPRSLVPRQKSEIKHCSEKKKFPPPRNKIYFISRERGENFHYALSL